MIPSPEAALFLCECGLAIKHRTVWSCPICGSEKELTEISASSLVERYNKLLAVAWKLRHPA